VVLVALAGATAGCLAPDAMGIPEAGTKETVVYRYTMFNSTGFPLLTNQYATGVLMGRLDPGYNLFNATEYVALNATFPSEKPTPFGVDFEQYLRKGQAGETIITSIIPANSTLTGTDGTVVSVPRRVGPFPLEEEVPRDGFVRTFPNATVGSVVQLNLRFQARVEAMTPEKVTFRYLVEDGATTPYPEFGPNATLRTRVDLDGQVFFDQIDIPLGEPFHRKNDRILNLTHGYYFVKSLSEESIELGGLRSPMLNHAFEDVYFVIEIINRQ
jgi:hypothetical protein